MRIDPETSSGRRDWKDIMAQEKINQPIRLMAEFDKGKIKPIIFSWNNRNHTIKKINLAYRDREGQSVNYYFGIETTDGGIFKIKYNDQKLLWTIEEQWVD